MSLREKVTKRAEEVKAQTIEQEAKSIQEKLAEIDIEIQAVNARKEKIANLQLRLRDRYGLAQEGLSTFKEAKTEIQNIYELNKEVLAEDGVETFSDMVKANPDEEEVVDYETSSIKGKEDVMKLTDIKTALKEEMPELDLKFTGGKKDEEEMSNRELAFIKIDEYLAELDQEIIGLEEKKENVKLETKEGKVEACRKELNLGETFRYVEAKKIDSFNVNHNAIELGKKHGEETVKEVLQTELQNKLEKDIFNAKPRDVQAAIDAYPKIKNIMEIKDVSREFDATEKLEQQAIKHIVSIFEKNEEARMSVSSYGTRGKDLNDLAKNYLIHVTNLSSLPGSSVSGFRESYDHNQERINKRDFSNAVFSSEYFSQALKTYNSVFEYIINNVDEKTEFVNNSTDSHDTEALTHRFNSSNSKNVREDIWQDKPKNASSYEIDVPRKFISLLGSFEKARLDAQRESVAWDQEKLKIAEASQATIDVKWANSKNQFYKEENKAVIDEINNDKERQKSIAYLAMRLEDLPDEDRERVIVINPDSSVKDVSAEKEEEARRKELQELKQRRDEYIQGLIKASQAEIDKIGTGLFSSKTKRAALLERVGYLNKITAGTVGYVDYNEGEAQKNTTRGENEDLNSFYNQRKTIDEKNLIARQKSSQFSKVFQFTEIKFSPNDPLGAKEMTANELMNRAQQISNELREYLNKLPAEKQAILNQVEENEKEAAKVSENYRNNAWKYRL